MEISGGRGTLNYRGHCVGGERAMQAWELLVSRIVVEIFLRLLRLYLIDRSRQSE